MQGERRLSQCHHTPKNTLQTADENYHKYSNFYIYRLHKLGTSLADVLSANAPTEMHVVGSSFVRSLLVSVETITKVSK